MKRLEFQVPRFHSMHFEATGFALDSLTIIVGKKDTCVVRVPANDL